MKSKSKLTSKQNPTDKKADLNNLQQTKSMQNSKFKQN